METLVSLAFNAAYRDFCLFKQCNAYSILKLSRIKVRNCSIVCYFEWESVLTTGDSGISLKKTLQENFGAISPDEIKYSENLVVNIKLQSTE